MAMGKTGRIEARDRRGGERDGKDWQPRNTGKRRDEASTDGRGSGKGTPSRGRPSGPRKPRAGEPGSGPGKPRGGEPGAERGKPRSGDADTTGRRSRGSGADAGRGKPRTGAPDAGRGKPREGARTGPRRGDRRPPSPLQMVAAGNDLLYGRNAVIEALRGRREPKRLWIAEGIREDERTRTIARLAAERNVVVDTVPRELLDDAMRGANHQGVAMETGPYDYLEFSELLESPGTVLVLDHLQDPQNFGTLLRAAEAAGVAGVVIPDDRAVEVTPAVVNASAGAVEHLRVAAVPNLPRALEDLKDSGRWVLGLAGEAGAVDLFTADVPTPAVLVVGAEGAGLGQRVRTTCDLLVSLPMLGRVESLNAATAGSIALYDLLRRERANESAAAEKAG